mmetsp:Transcript_20682/g.26750  ORF Transcript_20682/g.26750 Transcript_20682/m.26750 type:complete len:195 (+) Transcript_20682:259-843(+)
MINFQTSFKRLFLNSRPTNVINYIWYFSVLLKFIIFILSCDVANGEAKIKEGGTIVLTLAAVYVAVFQIVLAVAGTFILRRMPTSFAVGFLLGSIILAAQQNIVIFASFRSFYLPRNKKSHKVLSGFTLFLSIVYIIFALFLTTFRDAVIVKRENMNARPSIESSRVLEGEIRTSFSSMDNTKDDEVAKNGIIA